MRILILGLLLLAGCTNTDTGDGTATDCDPVGTWELTVTTISGDCGYEFPGTHKGKFTTDEKKNMDLDACSLFDVEKINEPETDESYELDGELESESTFDGDLVIGTAKLKADLLESGEHVGTCTQKYRISGKRE